MGNENGCVNCGRPRVAGSPSREDCLQVRLKEELRQKRALQGIIEGQDLTIGKLRALCKRLLDHIVNDRVSAAALATSMFENWRKKELADDGRLEMLLKCRQGLAKMAEKEAGDEKNGV